jgi:lysyl-tRNA synthetase class 2
MQMDRHQSDPSRSPLPTASLSHLRARAGVLHSIRDFFAKHDYLEVETPLLSRDVCVDEWIEPFEVLSGANRFFLQTSPELHMKRLLAAGARRIYQLTRSFRVGERGSRHNPEFTILEWYAAGETYMQQMDFVEKLIRTMAAGVVDGDPNGIRVKSLPPPDAPFPRRPYDHAFADCLGRHVLSLSVEELRDLARQFRVAVPASLRPDDRDGWLNLLLSAVVEPVLAQSGAVFVHDYPASQAALARVREDSPPVAERFELYLDGIEICNGYQELTDADELDRRMKSHARQRRRAGLIPLPLHNRLSDAMRSPGIPECAGVALGVDRLVMWMLNAKRLDEIVAFPIDRA